MTKIVFNFFYYNKTLSKKQQNLYTLRLGQQETYNKDLQYLNLD